MYCRRCKIKMEETRGTHHKKKKWRCPTCGRARMEAVSLKHKNQRRRANSDWRD